MSDKFEYHKADKRMSKIIEELSENFIIKVCSWGYGLGCTESGIIILKDKKFYKYCYHTLSMSNVDDYIAEKELTEKDFNEIIEFLKNEILDKDIELSLLRTRDSGNRIEVNYDGDLKEIYDTQELYNAVSEHLDKIWQNIEVTAKIIKYSF